MAEEGNCKKANLDVTNTPTSCTIMLLCCEKVDSGNSSSGLEIWSHRRAKYAESHFGGRPNAESRPRSECDGPHVEGTSLMSRWNPIGISSNNFANCIEENLLETVERT